MKRIIILVLGLTLMLPVISQAQQQTSGRLRALQQRADTVVKQKNNFAVMVLKAYEIPHQVNDQGVVTRIQVRDQWHDVTAFEIVPVIAGEEGDAAGRFRGHKLYFFTAEGVLELVSDLTVH
ncbi:MAG: hypothetical protein SWH68_11755 [Thermodesulfobacteriota bacterium]|nr:hypothetical protein [Thermodesulfobacteriota bacterium]